MLLHAIFIETGRFPSEVLALPRGERAFLFASILTEFENRKKA